MGKYSEENKEVFDYNCLLWTLFLSICDDTIKDKENRVELTQSLDLLKAVNSYRSYTTPEKLYEAYPELEAQKDYVLLLWKHFDGLSTEELSDLCITMIHEVLP